MKIKYLQDAPRGNKGDTAEVPDIQANVLIMLGIAEEYKATPKRVTKNKEETKTEDSE